MNENITGEEAYWRDRLMENINNPKDFPPPAEPKCEEPRGFMSFHCSRGVIGCRHDRPPTSSPESVEDRKCACDSDGLCKYHGELEDRARAFYKQSQSVWVHELMASFAQAEIERQTPAIIERFGNELLIELDTFTGFSNDELATVAMAMQTVKARREGGEGK